MLSFLQKILQKHLTQPFIWIYTTNSKEIIELNNMAQLMLRVQRICKRSLSHLQLVKRIKRNDVVPVIQRVDWTSGSPYNYWNSRAGNLEDGSYSYYALASNGVVYLCLSNNEKNRSDLSMQIASTSEPNHILGIEK